MNGGYKILDLAGFPITIGNATGTTVAGLYDAIESTFKPILIRGLTLIATFNLGFAPGTEGNTVHTGYTIKIDDDDAATVASWSITATTTA